VAPSRWLPTDLSPNCNLCATPSQISDRRITPYCIGWGGRNRRENVRVGRYIPRGCQTARAPSPRQNVTQTQFSPGALPRRSSPVTQPPMSSARVNPERPIARSLKPPYTHDRHRPKPSHGAAIGLRHPTSPVVRPGCPDLDFRYRSLLFLRLLNRCACCPILLIHCTL
jgi:hypothetical protein